ncbi:unnamed protein product [Rangifer tarandus platyrhynchus]|uniref:Uncharacterized protein n=1 Tax=Rangifer tarandus platyrhynchus TaxID=3082113 RepID=A0ABN8Z132_RANTA|nr:unnamed protein product [Rangifer tarandus platyrhynchus]
MARGQKSRLEEEAERGLPQWHCVWTLWRGARGCRGGGQAALAAGNKVTVASWFPRSGRRACPPDSGRPDLRLLIHAGFHFPCRKVLNELSRIKRSEHCLANNEYKLYFYYKLINAARPHRGSNVRGRAGQRSGRKACASIISQRCGKASLGLQGPWTRGAEKRQKGMCLRHFTAMRRGLTGLQGPRTRGAEKRQKGMCLRHFTAMRRGLTGTPSVIVDNHIDLRRRSRDETETTMTPGSLRLPGEPPRLTSAPSFRTQRAFTHAAS